ncbi:MAG: hypothetical protein WDO13_08335 [Verrucomicrobiota bacterium]
MISFICQLVAQGNRVRSVAQVGEGIDSTTAATFDDGVEDGTAFAGLGFADEQPILFPKGGGGGSRFRPGLVDFDASVVEVDAEERAHRFNM